MSLAAAVVTVTPPLPLPARSTRPSIEYSQLAPMLVVFGAAVIGVLVEAFVPRELRRAVHLLVTFGALLAAFVWTCVIAASSTMFAKGSAGHVRRWARSRWTGPRCSSRARSSCSRPSRCC